MRIEKVMPGGEVKSAEHVCAQCGSKEFEVHWRIVQPVSVARKTVVTPEEAERLGFKRVRLYTSKKDDGTEEVGLLTISPDDNIYRLECDGTVICSGCGVGQVGGAMQSRMAVLGVR
jgi:hypothetical protein